MGLDGGTFRRAPFNFHPNGGERAKRMERKKRGGKTFFFADGIYVHYTNVSQINHHFR
jgi:hypothetical protein